MNSDVVTSSSEQCNSITGEDDSSNKTRIKQGATNPTKIQNPNRRKDTIIFATLIAAFFLLLSITIAFGIANQQNHSNGGESEASRKTSADIMTIHKHQILCYPSSCFEAKRRGMSTEIIKIKPQGSFPYDVYCDMKSAGGGWTLIASIHEDNIKQKCREGDKWSSESGLSESGYWNWENLLTFGDIRAATSADFKSPAYSNLPATDLMIWHVPNNVPSRSISDEAFFKYYTDTHFLKTYGSTLQSLFTEYAPLRQAAITGFTDLAMPCFTSNLYLGQTRPERLPSTSNSFIKFDDKVYIRINSGPFILLKANQTNNVSSGIEIAFETSNPPYVMLGWVSNGDKSIESLTVKVIRSDEVYLRRRHFRYDSTHPYQFRYAYMCLRNSPVCKLLFYVQNVDVWSSKFRQITTNFGSAKNFTFTLKEDIHHVFVGYAVVPSSGKIHLTPSLMKRVFLRIAKCLEKIDLTNLNKNPSISSPAKFIKGSMDSFTGNVTPGFIQLRKYDAYGYPHALCPGLRVDDGADPSLYCVGSVRTHNTHRSRCGDFAAWDKLAEHSRKRATSPGGFHGSVVNDITSSLLIFAR